MPISVSQSIAKQRTAGAGSLTSAAFGSTTQSGNTIIVTGTTWRSGATPLPIVVTDSAGNTYTVVLGGIETAAHVGAYIAYAYNIVGGASHTVTVNPTGTTGPIVFGVIEVSGLTTTDPLDKSAEASGTSTAPSSGSTGTLSQADELVVGAMTNDGAQASITAEVTSPIWNTIYEELTDTYQPGEGDYKIVSATTALTANWTITSDAWVAVIATFKGAVSPFLARKPLVVGQAVQRATVR